MKVQHGMRLVAPASRPENVNDLPAGVLCTTCETLWMPETFEEFEALTGNYLVEHAGHELRLIVEIEDGSCVTMGRLKRDH